MAWDGKKLPDALATSATAAAVAAGNGSKNAAYLTHIQTAIGSAYKRQLVRNDVRVWEATASGTLPISGSTFVLPQVATQNTISSADIDTGEWVHYIVKSSEASSSKPTSGSYIATNVTKTGGAGPAFLTADLGGSDTVQLGSFDTTVADPDSLASAYASCMGENDFPPGNLENGTWPQTAAWPNSPYGSTINTQAYIVDPTGNRFLMWGWIMPPKLQRTTVGNWRVQMRDFQAGVKVDSLAGSWNLFFGPTAPPNYGLNNLGGLRLSGNITNSANTTLITLHDVNQNPLEVRAEATGGVSFKNVGTADNIFQVECNVPDGNPLTSMLPSNATSSRCKAFVGMYWCRLIPDTGSTISPSDVTIGAINGIDFYNDGGRLGTPGQSRLVRLTTAWKPIVQAYVMHDSGTRMMTAAETHAWLSANPPPFS
jgi:hypothetical protein